jgi:hypothetical protein
LYLKRVNRQTFAPNWPIAVCEDIDHRRPIPGTPRGQEDSPREDCIINEQQICLICQMIVCIECANEKEIFFDSGCLTCGIQICVDCRFKTEIFLDNCPTCDKMRCSECAECVGCEEQQDEMGMCHHSDESEESDESDSVLEESSFPIPQSTMNHRPLERGSSLINDHTPLAARAALVALLGRSDLNDPSDHSFFGVLREEGGDGKRG